MMRTANPALSSKTFQGLGAGNGNQLVSRDLPATKSGDPKFPIE